jgi:WhiB family redox-sensing transcriptional regulator
MSFHDQLDGTQPCRYDPDLFFPSQGNRAVTPRAKAVCRACPFQPECLQYALAHAVHGVWGGTTLGERNAYRRARKITPIPVTVHPPHTRHMEAVV